MKVEVTVLGSPSLTVRAYGVCGRAATLNSTSVVAMRRFLFTIVYVSVCLFLCGTKVDQVQRRTTKHVGLQGRKREMRKREKEGERRGGGE